MSYTTDEAFNRVDANKALFFQNKASIAQHQNHNDDLLDFQVKVIKMRSSIVTQQEMEQCTSDNIDIETLKLDMGTSFYNYNAVKALGCAVDAAFYGLAEDSGNLAHVANLKNEIKGMKKIGGPSVSGNALLGGIGKASDLYVSKIPQTKDGEIDLTHELFVGLYGTNELRKIGVPNFAVVLGGPMCSPAVIDEKEVTSVCSGIGDRVQYVIYENIAPAEALNKYMLHATADEFLSVYMQELYTSLIAEQLIGFTHYDAHTENKIARMVPNRNKFSIAYPIPGTKKEVFVSSTVVSSTIDYGMSSIRYDDTDFGANNYDLSVYGVEAGPNPLYDAYKLLMFIGYDLYNAKKTSSKVFIEAAKIFTYFNAYDNFLDAVIDQRELYYCFVRGPSTNHLTIQGLIDHVHKVCNLSKIVTNTPMFPVLECGGSGNYAKCFTFEGEIRRAVSHKKIPTDFLQFYDEATHYTTHHNKDKYSQLVDAFDYKSAKKNFIVLIENEMSQLKTHLTSPKLAIVPALRGQVSVDTLRSTDNMKVFSDGLTQVLSAVSAYENVSIWLKVGVNVSTLFQDRSLHIYIDEQRMALASLQDTLMSAIELYRSNYRIITPIIDTPSWIQTRHSKYPWYRDSASTIVGLVDKFRRDEKELFNPIPLPSSLVPVTTTKERSSVLPRNRGTNLVKTANGVPISINCKK